LLVHIAHDAGDACLRPGHLSLRKACGIEITDVISSQDYICNPKEPPMSQANVPISEAESHVMEVLWQQAPLSSEQIVDALQQHSDWHEKTIRTLLNRLLSKGAVEASAMGAVISTCPC
jgi:hypothetical protein